MGDRQNEWNLYAILIRSGGHEWWLTAQKNVHLWLDFIFRRNLEWVTARTNETCMRFSFVLAVMNGDDHDKGLAFRIGFYF